MRYATIASERKKVCNLASVSFCVQGLGCFVNVSVDDLCVYGCMFLFCRFGGVAILIGHRWALVGASTPCFATSLAVANLWYWYFRIQNRTAHPNN